MEENRLEPFLNALSNRVGSRVWGQNVSGYLHRRFAVRRLVTFPEVENSVMAGVGASSHHDSILERPHTVVAEDGKSSGALLFELTLDGCRISNIDHRRFAPDQMVQVNVPGFGMLEGRVRTAGLRTVALRYCRPLQRDALNRLLGICRAEEA